LSLSSDGSQLITTEGSSVSSIWRCLPTSKTSEQITGDSPRLEGRAGLAMAPDGRIVYSVDEFPERNLWISDNDWKKVVPLTSKAKMNQAPAVSPDGRYIVFDSSRSGAYRIWRMNLDGSGAIQLTEDTANSLDFDPIISHDGKSILFERTYVGDAAPSRIMQVAIDGGEAENVLADDLHGYFLPELSPDDRHIEYTSYDVKTFDRNVVISAYANGSVGRVEHEFALNLFNNMKWSPDGQSLTFYRAEGVGNIFKVDLDGQKVEPMTDLRAGRILNYAWSDDGRYLFYVRGIVNSDLILMRSTDR